MNRNRYKKASSRIAKRRQAKRAFGLFLKISLPVGILIGLVFLSRADFLQVKDFEVLGAETLPQESIKNAAAGFASGTSLFLLPKSNIFIVNKEKLANALLSKFTRLQKVEVNKQFFTKKIELSVTERESDFLWCSVRDECFAMTKEGLVFEKVGYDGGKIIFRGLLEGDPLMENFATPEKMQNYSEFIETFKDADFGISSIGIESFEKAVAETDIGDIIFNPEEENLASIAQNVVLLINEVRSKNPSAVFQYIDARFGNKFFYKLI